ncbi:helix-turn-helix domain-containing protein [Streptomyces naganishii]|uniref:HTH cro/C1-type domain-containing protein n=1 Tax=Streptomyces naganishii JCM 4654 TaxID=1306179 RepID=A0A918YA10_9ACTN|nr:DUF2690 domain-containing protein [Streptomyces naganishii]GHD94569.1 hypothetical protein GCM10010508_55920 [Streptomyces naganishii JCM 4654]
MARWKALPEELDPQVREFASQLRRVVDRGGLSVAALADRTGYSRTSWDRYLNGRLLAPKGAVVALAEVTGTEPAHLVTMWELAERAWSRAELRHDRTMEAIRISRARAALSGPTPPTAPSPETEPRDTAVGGTPAEPRDAVGRDATVPDTGAAAAGGGAGDRAAAGAGAGAGGGSGGRAGAGAGGGAGAGAVPNSWGLAGYRGPTGADGRDAGGAAVAAHGAAVRGPSGPSARCEPSGSSVRPGSAGPSANPGPSGRPGSAGPDGPAGPSSSGKDDGPSRPAPPSARGDRGRGRRAVMFLAGLAGVLVLIGAVFYATGGDRGGKAAGAAKSPSPSATTPLKLPAGVKCAGASCTGKDAESMGCSGNLVSTARSVTVGNALLEVRYSRTCGAAWGRITRAGQGDEVRVVAGGRQETGTVTAAGDTIAYTPMIAVRDAAGAKACATLASGRQACTDQP